MDTWWKSSQLLFMQQDLSQVQTSGDDSWYGVITFSTEYQNLIFCLLWAGYVTSWQDSFYSSVVSFFLSSNTTKAFFFLFSSFTSETNSTRLIQLPVAGILYRGLKIHWTISLFTCLIFISVYVDECCWCHGLHVLWIMAWCLTLSKSKKELPRQYLLHNSLLAGVWNWKKKVLHFNSLIDIT